MSHIGPNAKSETGLLPSAYEVKPEATRWQSKRRSEADFVFDSRDVRLLGSPGRGSASRLGTQMRGHFVTHFTPFISELGYKEGPFLAKWDQAPR